MPKTEVLNPAWWQTFPLEDFHSLLRYDGLWRDEASGIWIAARHADVLHVERDAVTFASRVDDAGMYRLQPSEFEATMIANNDPVHLAQRRVINRRFTPRAVKSHTEHYDAMVSAMVDRATDEHDRNGSCEVINALAAQLPCRVTAELLGFGQERWPEVKSWSERQMRIDRRYDDPEAFDGLNASIQEWAIVMQDLLPQRMVEPADDLFTDWIKAGMDPMTMVQETGLLIAGGAETTRTVIAHGIRTFVDHPDQWDYIAGQGAGPDRAKRLELAVEELIRWVTPLNNMFRVATVDTEVAGTPIAAGERVLLLYPAANRDPLVFDKPDTFDVTRDPNPHVAFGHGTHFCLGANLARAELRMMFGELAARWTNLRVVDEMDIEPNIFARAVTAFSLGFDLR